MKNIAIRHSVGSFAVGLVGITLVLFLTASNLTQAFELDLVNLRADYTGTVNNPSKYGSFSIIISLTATDMDVFVRKDYNIFDGLYSHTTILLNGNYHVTSPAEGYLISPVSYPSDTSDWYSVPEGESRNFQFILPNFAAPQTGLYSWGLDALNPLEIADAPGGTIQDFILVNTERFRTDQLYLIQVVPEPSAIILFLLIGSIFMIGKRL